MKLRIATAALTIFAGWLFFFVFCINTQNPFDPNNPDYALPSMTFEDFPVKEGDTVAADSLFFVVRGNYKENYFRWWKESPDSADTNWTEWSGNNRWNDTMILTKLREGRYRLHIQTAYHWNGDITDTSVTFYKVNTPIITNQSDTLVQSAVAMPCTLWVKASGTPPLTCQWYKDTAKIGGKISDTLFFASLTVSDTGRYRCFVSNGWGGVPSAFVRLSVSPRCRILYNGNSATGGTAPTDSKFYKAGDTVAVMGNTGNLAKTGSVFTGWNTAAGGSGKTYAPGDTIIVGSADVLLYAKWTVNQYTVIFNSLGGSPISPQTVSHGSSATKPPAPAKTGYSFAGWFRDSLCTVEWSFSGDTITGNVTLFAKWVAAKDSLYTVTFSSQGRSAVPPQTVKHGNAVTKPAAPAKTGYTFGGWFRDSLCTIEWSFSGDMVTGNLTLYAKWLLKVANTFTVIFNSQGGSTVQPQTVDSGAHAIEPPAPAKTGHEFAGWFKDSLCLYAWNFAGDKITGAVTLFAKWVPFYTVTYHGNGNVTGSAPTDTNKYTQGAAVTVKTNSGDLKKPGYSFDGWNTKTDGSGTSYAENGVFPMGVKNVDLYAKWKMTAYSITYLNLDNATNADNPASYTVESPTITLKPAVKNGYDFRGWYMEAGFVTKADSVPKGSTGEKTFYARWTPANYSITYLPNGGEFPVSAPKSYTIETPTFDLPPATKTSYTFDGWYSDSIFTTKTTKIPIGSIGDKKFYAKWVVMDIDGNTYTTVTIGTQVWMVENLKTTKYYDGTPIPLVTDSAAWSNLTTPGFCWYNNDESNKAKYGALYNWYTVITKKLAPTGWHVPDTMEWNVLQDYLVTHGYNYDGSLIGNRIAKSMAAKTDWNMSPKEGAIGNDLLKNNSSGFSALPGGRHNQNYSPFLCQNDIGYWWCATEGGWHHALGYDSHYLHRYCDSPKMGYSVRLIRD